EVLSTINASQETRLSKNILDGISDSLENEDVFIDYQKRTVIALQYSKSKQAYQMLQNLRSILANQSQEIKNKYSEIVVWLTYAALGYLSQQELETFFKEAGLRVILEDEAYGDLINTTRNRLALEKLRDRNSLREKIYNALHENSSILSSGAINEGEKGTIASWLKALDAKTGVGPASSIVRAEFENDSAVQAKLDSEAKKALKRLLDFYEFIKLSSFELEAFEEHMLMNDGKKDYLLSNGVLEEIKEEPEEPAQGARQEDAQAVKQPASKIPNQQTIVQNAGLLLKKSNGNIKLVMDSFYNGVVQANALTALSTLILLAQLRKLDNILEDQRFSSLVIQDLQKNNLNDQVQGMRINPAAPQYVARFLKIVLEDKLKLSHQDAISFGKKLVAILVIEGEKYKSIISDNKWKM
ncbi:hypothetical protein CL632_03820, partial [bacterium]|nr:hypothetical protein [bacterium]